MVQSFLETFAWAVDWLVLGLRICFAHTLLLLLFCWLGLACELVEGLVSFSALTFLKYF